MLEYIEREAVDTKLFTKRAEWQKHWRDYLEQLRMAAAYSTAEQAVDNWLRGYNQAVDDYIEITDPSCTPVADVVDRAYVVYLLDFFGGMSTWSNEVILSEIKRKLVEDAPLADVEVVRHGEWNENIIGFCNVCMECGAIVERTAIKNKSGELNYCPNCGAKMDGKGDGG